MCVCVCVCVRARAHACVLTHACIHTHKHMCICIRFLVEGNSEYSRSVLGYLNNGTTAIFIAVVGTSLIWNFNAGLAELEAMKAEALAEAEGGVSKLDLFAVVCAVKLINKCVRNRIAMRYNWDQASSIGGDSLVELAGMYPPPHMTHTRHLPLGATRWCRHGRHRRTHTRVALPAGMYPPPHMTCMHPPHHMTHTRVALPAAPRAALRSTKKTPRRAGQ